MKPAPSSILLAALVIVGAPLSANAEEQCGAFALSLPGLPKFLKADEAKKPTLIAEYEAPTHAPPDPALVAERREALRKASAPAAVVSGTELILSSALESYAAGIVQKLLAGYKGTKPDPAVRVRIIADRYGNAFAGYDNTVYVPATLVAAVQNEDQLAFLIAHELGHVLKQDFLSSGFLTEQKELANRLAHAGVAGAAVATTRVEKSPSGGIMVTNKSQEALPKAARAASMGYFIAQEVADTLIAPGWTSAQEDNADKFGVDLMVRAGYNPEGALDVFDIMVDRNCQGLKLFDRVNSSFGERIQQSVTSLVHVDQTGLHFSSDEAKKVASRYGREMITSAAFEARSMRQNATHKSAKRRASALDNYIAAHYADIPMPETRVAPLKSAVASAGVPALVKRITATYSSRDALAAGDLPAATKTLTPGSEAFFQFTTYEVRLAQFEAGQGAARYSEAFGALQAGAASPTATPAVYSALAVELANSGRGQEALSRIDDAGKRFGSPEAFWPIKIAVHQKLGQRAKADDTLAKCKSEGTSKLASLCENAYQTADPKAAQDAATSEDAPDAKGKKAKEKDLMSVDTLKSVGDTVGDTAASVGKALDPRQLWQSPKKKKGN